MFTFSQLVDEMVSETKRPDLVSEIARYLNQTVRELHFTEDRNAMILYADNFRESLLTADAESGFQWEIPDPTTFQKLEVVKLSNVWDDDSNNVYSTPTTPGRHLNGMNYYHYRVGSTFVFSGYGGLDANLGIGWYEFPRSLKYRAVAARPASYDIDSGWTYADGVNTDELQAAARELVTNWLILRWNDVVAEGLRAKVYKRVSDDSRARTSYSLYQSLRHGLWTSGTAEISGG